MQHNLLTEFYRSPDIAASVRRYRIFRQKTALNSPQKIFKIFYQKVLTNRYSAAIIVNVARREQRKQNKLAAIAQ